MIKIERNVPMPLRRTGRPNKYPFSNMKVGDSFAITGGTTAINVREAIRYYRTKDAKARFVVRKFSPDQSRCWRVE